MTNLPTKVKLSPKDASELKQLSVKAESIRTFIQTVTEQGEKRIVALQNETAEFWQRAAETYNLDIMHVNYTLGPDGEHAVPMAMRFEAE